MSQNRNFCQESKESLRSKGFTLIELLVTISIIAILASILFPVFSKARESARRASCMSNLKQIGLGVMMYVQDYDGRYPYGINKYPIPDPTTSIGWRKTIAPYTMHYGEHTQLYRCPSSYLKEGGAHDESISDFGAGNYGANYAVLVSSSALPQGISQSIMNSPSTTYMIMDAGGPIIRSVYVGYYPNGDKLGYLPGTGPGTGNHLASAGTWNVNFPALEADFTGGRHFGGVNMLFADGHVKWLKSHKVVLEAKPCGGSSCLLGTGPSSTAKSAWNPVLGGPANN